MTRRRTSALAEKPTREQILDVTLDAIQTEGLQSLTIRRIAERAGVNVAAVNYHFGSKEALLDEVLGLLTSDLRDTFAVLGEAGAPPRERLRRFLDAFSTALLQHPEIYRQALGAGLADVDAHRRYLSFLRAEGLYALKALVREVTGEADERRLSLRVLQAVGGLIYPLLVAPLLEQAVGLRLSEDAVRREHVTVCLEALLGRDTGRAAKQK